jgi:hypothetical protein
MFTAQQRGSFPLPTASQGSETSLFAAVAGINPDYLRLEAQNTPTVCAARSGPPSLSSRIKTSNFQGQATTAGLTTPPAPSVILSIRTTALSALLCIESGKQKVQT